MATLRGPLLGHSESFESLIGAVADCVGLGVWSYIPDSETLHWSDQAKEILGLSHSREWTCSEFLNQVHSLDRQRLVDATSASLDPAIRSPLNVEYRVHGPDGRMRWVLVKGVASFDPQKHCVAEMSGIIVDVSAHKQTEARLEVVVQSAHDAVVTIDLDTKIVDWNPAATRLYGYSAEEMLGNTVNVILPPELAQETSHVYGRARQGETVSSFRTERIRKDGKRIQILLTVSPIFDSTGEVRGISKVAKDITEQLVSEEQLRQAQRMESIGLLAGGIAHDFNNLLTVINGYASRLISQVPEPAETRRQLLYIDEAGKRAQSLTQQLLAFSRKQVLQPRVVSLSSVTRDLVPLIGRLIREDVEIVTKFDPSTDRVEIDRNQLEQVLLNLVVNASDAMPNGGRLTIETGPLAETNLETRRQLGLKAGSYLVLSVSDSGTGISPEILPQIFDPFFTTKAIGRGTGLGLASVHGIATQSGGSVAAFSEVGVGTTMRVYLPASDEEIDDVPKEPTRIEAPVPGGETILVVEDDALLRRYTTEVLSDLGYRVIQAANGIEALRASESAGTIDLLVTDVVMPAMSGRQLAETLTHQRPRIQVLYISGYNENTIAEDRVLAPGVWYLPKPFTPHQIEQKVQEILHQTRGTKNVLVVDDDPAVRRCIADMLTASGYTVSQASEGVSAIDVCKEQTVDLILLDLVMPEQEGISTLRSIKKSNPKSPIIAMSGFPGYLAPARALGAAAILAKPISVGALVQSIRGLIG